ncbi:zinc finger protein basonuclin-2-like [Schistocerca serialis cubense]|uniref:zinc finger protein basonuclin-2-like n=1 Tax=Schistocerca serialis cubense TaxID=2023355 RepID=UPI00214ECCEF|nr:zinc finger protein basonuclin-2-like [Schistocerca serialis cubense]
MRDSQHYVIMGTDEGCGDVMTAEEKAAEMREELGDCTLPQSTVKSEKTSTTGLRCAAPACFCPSFCPGQEVMRSCDSCGHGWLSHALPQLPHQSDVEHAASLVLYGCQALPIRLKILLDRLFSSVGRRQLAQLLLQFGWTLDDYARGYIVRDACGERLDSWQMCSAEEESALVRACVRFADTHSLALQLLAACDGPPPHAGVGAAAHHTAHALPPSPARTSPPASPPHAAPGKVRLPPLEVLQDAAPSPLLAASPSPSTSASLWPGARGSSTPAVLASPGASISDGGSSEECNGAYETALDLSRDGCSPRPKSGSGKMGKASGWNSRSGGVSATEMQSGGSQGKPALGKKRVQCNVCLKTFCDKGALKIHFSAVHLREMHKCTVEGCNMMFSSRRSRNRHSANPNPKLHQLQFRRADLAVRYPSRLPADAAPAGLGAAGAVDVGVGGVSAEDTLTRVLSLRLLQGARPELRFEDSTQTGQVHTSSEDSSMSPKNNGAVYEGESDADTKAGGGDGEADEKPEPSWLKRLQRRWQQESGEESPKLTAPEDASAAETPAAAPEPPQRGTRKRKSQHPTRCAAVAGESPAKLFASDSLSSEDDCRL